MPLPEEQFVYRAKRQARPVDPVMRSIALGAAAISAIIIVVALAWSGVRATGFGPPPTISPPPGPLRTAPATPGGLTVPGADEPILAGTPPTAAATLAPAAPAPDITQLNSQK
jgi:hypothetical protein